MAAVPKHLEICPWIHPYHQSDVLEWASPNHTPHCRIHKFTGARLVVTHVQTCFFLRNAVHKILNQPQILDFPAVFSLHRNVTM